MKLFVLFFVLITTICITQINTSPVAVSFGGTSRTTITAYATLCSGSTATGALQVTGPGSSSNYLTSNGSAAVPTYQALTTGSVSFILVESQTASTSSELIFSTILDMPTTNCLYLFIFKSLVPSTAAVLNMDFSIDGGATYVSTGYESGYLTHAYNSVTLTNATSTSTCPIGPSNSNGFSGYIILQAVDNGPFLGYSGQGMYDNSGEFIELFGFNPITPTDIEAIKFSLSSGTINSGTISLYRVATA